MRGVTTWMTEASVATFPLAMVGAAAAKEQTPEPSCAGRPPVFDGWPVCCDMSIPDISIPATSWLMLWAVIAPGAGV